MIDDGWVEEQLEPQKAPALPERQALRLRLLPYVANKEALRLDSRI